MATASSKLNLLGISYDSVVIWNLLDDTLPLKFTLFNSILYIC